MPLPSVVVGWNDGLESLFCSYRKIYRMFLFLDFIIKLEKFIYLNANKCRDGRLSVLL